MSVDKKLWFAWLLAPIVCLLAYRSVLEFEFIGDAIFLIKENLYMHDLSFWWQNLIHDYFWSSSGNIIPYWRPLTKISWLAEYWAFGDWAGGFQVVQLGWHVLGTIGVGLIARALGLHVYLVIVSGLIFALHPIAIAAVSMIMARSDVVCHVSLIWAFLCLLWFGRSGKPIVMSGLILFFYGLALASKETALCFVPVVLFFLFFSKSLRDHRQRQLYLAGLVCLQAGLYFGLRAWVLSSEHPGLINVSLEFDPKRIFGSLGLYLVNLQPLNWASSVRDIASAEIGDVSFLLKTIASFVVYVFIGIYFLKKRADVALCCWAWILLALAPVLVVGRIHVPQLANQYSLADRWLYHSLGPACIVWVALIKLALNRKWQRGVMGLVFFWAFLMLGSSNRMRSGFANEMAFLENEDRVYFQNLPEAYRSEEDYCRHWDRQAVKSIWLKKYHEALGWLDKAGECKMYRWERMRNRFSVFVALNDFQRASKLIPKLFEQKASDRRFYPLLTQQAGEVYFRVGEYENARFLLERAFQFGLRSCRIELMYAQSNEKLKLFSEAARSFESAFSCHKNDDVSLLFKAIEMWMKAGQKDHVQRLKLFLTTRKFQLNSEQHMLLKNL